MNHLKVFAENGKNKVRIERTKYQIELSICTNGWQWTGQDVNMEIFDLIDKVIKEFKEGIDDEIQSK